MKNLFFRKKFKTPQKANRCPLLFALCLCLTLFIQGCSLALEELPARRDRLAGLFVTEKYINSGMPELEFNSRGEILAASPEAEKIYGSFTGQDNGQNTPVSFPNLEGFGIYNLKFPESETQEAVIYNTCDTVFSDLHYTVSEGLESIEASLYVTADAVRSYYFNPVYQQEDGRIYLLPGSGISTDSFAPGQQFSHSISESLSSSENGKEESQGNQFTVNIVSAAAPDYTELLLLDMEDHVVNRLSGEELEQYFEAGLPLELPENVSYVILRQTTAENLPDCHMLFDQNSEYLEYKIPAENKYLFPRQLPLIWTRQTDGT